MRIKKIYKDVTVHFDILAEVTVIENESMLINILNSLHDFKFINKEKPFNDLVKEQQKHTNHILVPFEPKPYDELRFKIKAIFNFLLATDQVNAFSIDSIEVPIDNGTLTVYGVEILRERLNDKVGFSPAIRAEWAHPLIVEKILKLS